MSAAAVTAAVGPGPAMPFATLALLPASFELPDPKPVVAFAWCVLQIVSLSAACLTAPGVGAVPRARPWVTFWKFSLASPRATDIRVMPDLREALRGSEKPALGIGIRSIEGVRGLLCSIGLNGPAPVSE